jgi:polyferredoxin
MLGNLHPLQPGGIFMKAIIILALAASLGLTLAAHLCPSAAMSGKADFRTRGYNQAAKEKKSKSAKTVKPTPLTTSPRISWDRSLG